MKQPGLSHPSAPPADPSTGDFPPTPSAEAERETVFGRYRLLRRIGKGGMAEAFLAVMEGARGFQRKCVVKRIRPDKAGSTYFTQMFVDEARITAALHHPNIVQVYDFGEVDALFYLTMEYLDGRNLGAMLDGLHARGLLMPINFAAHISQQVARGLDYAHKLTDDQGGPLGVIHRDVSPSNVMLLHTGEVKILDFGVAKAESALKQGATVVGKVKGKLSYMAPEQHSGKVIDLRADVFAAGVMLWEMLTGELLFGGAKGGERSRRMMRGDVPAPSTLRSKVPPVLDAIVLRCLKVRPEERYPSASALADELGAFVRASLFDPAELAALVSDHAGDDTPATITESSGAPVAVDSRALLASEDPRVDVTDLDMMAATTTRERRRSLLGLPETGPASVLPRRLEPRAEEPTPPAPVAFVAPARMRRFWPVLVALAVGGGMALLLASRPNETTATITVTPRRTGARITQVPAVAPSVEPSTVLDPAPARPAEARPGDSASRSGGRPVPAARRRSRTAESPRAAEAPATSAVGPGGEPKLVNPF